MLTLVHLLPAALADPASTTALSSLAATDELVLVCAGCSPIDGVMPALRRVLPRQHVVALLVDGEVQLHERRLIEELLDEGSVPLVFTTDEPDDTTLLNWAWLCADGSVALPAAVA